MSPPPSPSPAISAQRTTPPLALLRGVSRSFYLSIRLLPPGLRQPIAVAYLLARATDTLADTSALPAAQRADLLSALAACIQHQPGDSTAVLGRINTTFAPLQHDPAEKTLLADLPQCLAWLAALPANDQADIRTVLRHITQGQTQDIATFGEANQGIRALANAAEVEDYTYRVAGCVGEFWTTLCFRHLEGFATLPQAQMQALGRRYGMGLQRINILRDLQADLAAGRCYLPADSLAAVGLAPADLRQPPEVFGTVYRHWLTETQALLDDGLAYALAVNPRRVRAASALPALVGARTLALLAAAGPVAQPMPVKMPRREMRGLMLRLALSLAGRGSLRGHYQRLSAPLPMGQSHP